MSNRNVYEVYDVNRMPFLPGQRNRGDGKTEVPSPDEVVNTNIYKHLTKMAQDTQTKLEETAREWKNIQEIMDFAASHVRNDWVDTAEKGLPSLLHELRSTRMAIGVELKQIQQSMADINEFLNGADAERRREQLRELVELCERFRRVQVDGTFDKVIEALLRQL